MGDSLRVLVLTFLSDTDGITESMVSGPITQTDHVPPRRIYAKRRNGMVSAPLLIDDGAVDVVLAVDEWQQTLINTREMALPTTTADEWWLPGSIARFVDGAFAKVDAPKVVDSCFEDFPTGTLGS